MALLGVCKVKNTVSRDFFDFKRTNLKKS